MVAQNHIYQRFYFDVIHRKVEVPYPETRILSLCASWGFCRGLYVVLLLFTFFRCGLMQGNGGGRVAQ